MEFSFKLDKDVMLNWSGSKPKSNLDGVIECISQIAKIYMQQSLGYSLKEKDVLETLKNLNVPKCFPVSSEQKPGKCPLSDLSDFSGCYTWPLGEPCKNSQKGEKMSVLDIITSKLNGSRSDVIKNISEISGMDSSILDNFLDLLPSFAPTFTSHFDEFSKERISISRDNVSKLLKCESCPFFSDSDAIPDEGVSHIWLYIQKLFQK